MKPFLYAPTVNAQVATINAVYDAGFNVAGWNDQREAVIKCIRETNPKNIEAYPYLAALTPHLVSFLSKETFAQHRAAGMGTACNSVAHFITMIKRLA